MLSAELSYPPQFLREDEVCGLVSLQEQEIRRLTDALRISEARCNALREQLQEAHLRTGKGSPIQSVPLPVGLSLSYDGMRIEPFYHGVSMPAQLLKHLSGKGGMFKCSTLKFSDEFIWDLESGFERGYMVKADQSLSRKGWTDNTKRKWSDANYVVARIGKAWYYLGIYQVMAKEPLDGPGFLDLPVKTQEDVIKDVCGPSIYAEQFEQMLRQGHVTSTKTHFRRIGFDEAFYHAALQVSAQAVGVVREHTPFVPRLDG